MSKLHPDPKPVILVVDDDALLRFLAVDILEAAGFAVIEAENAEGALTLLKSRPEIAALFTDIEMPGACDGLELAHRCHRERPDVRVVVTSGNIRPSETDLAPGDAFIAKPYRDREVIDRLRGRSKGRQAA
jgi:CheY-like chemotaxis protein